ncbi:PAS domain S-box protein [Vitiosangium sp. GDMCC 1.1324]|uniref:sensor histidine kinase n=1 Tax=Vitiosangium sp. (strain GDMCC 1.1324) TaxID=2138576 RepID=UPI000D3B0EA3|nr:PAS domain S-box protein [Vitiosangium sp. GDMCC 1.1324]PTL82451.1 histidine kinase [Vitiosangium sp. GDMCC 1.1324]
MTTSPPSDSLHRLAQVLEWLTPAAIALTLLVASLDLIGWGLASRFLVRVVPLQGAGIMMPNTAIGLLGSGLALWLLREEPADSRRRVAGRALALGVVLLGGLTFAEYSFGADLGIDGVFFSETVKRMTPMLPGRPSPLTALCFCVTGLALLLLHARTRRGWYPARFLVLATLFLSGQALIGYVYMEEGLFGPERFISRLPAFTPMAVHTALLFLLLSLGILSVHPEHGLMATLIRDDVGGHMARRLFPAAILAPLLVGGMMLLGARLGLYGATYGTSLFVLVTLAAFLGMVAWTARALSRLDAHQRSMAQSLRFSEARLAGIVSNAVDAIISIDEEQRIILFNAGAERIFGYSASDVLGHSLGMLIPERFRALHEQHIRNFAASPMETRQMAERQPITGQRKDGAEFPAEASIMTLAVDGTRLFTVILRDISARRRAEELLRESEARFRTSFEDASIGMALVGLDGSFLNVNGSLCGIVGYSQQELLSKTFQDITYPDDLKLDLTNVHRLLQGELSSYQMEKRYFHKQGHVVTVLLTASLVRDSQGAPRYFVSQIQDISERKQLEQAWRFLAEAGPRLASSLEPQATLATVARLAVPALADVCLVQVLGDDGKVWVQEFLAASPQKARVLPELFSVHPHPWFLQGHVVAEVLRTSQPLLLPEVLGPLLEPVAGDVRHLEQLRLLGLRSGLVVPLLARGRTLGVIFLFTSESGRLYGDRDLALAEELANRAALAIDNARLHAQSEQATRVRDEVLRIVAHDLRTPLNVITLSTGTLMKRLPGEYAAATKPLESIRKAVERANRLIQELLDVARMEAGHLSVTRALEETVPLVREVAELHRTLAEAKSIQFTAAVPEDCPPIFVDRDRVMQIFSNLLGNALKFTPEGGQITLRVEPVEGQVRFSVSDSGPGIPAEDLPHLFEPFWQARVGRKEGAGLGLAIVRGLVEAHGGQLWVESSPGMGSTFFFTLPTGQYPTSGE